MHTLLDRPAPAPALPPEDDDGRTLYIRGLLALRTGDAAAAVALLTGALRWQPRHRGMRRNLVRALLLAEQYGEVVSQANAALAAAPDDGELHFALGTALNALGQHARACAAFGRALALQPGHAPSWLNMGNASADLSDLDSAETLYRTAIRLDAALPEAFASLGHILTLQGRFSEAIEACESAIRVRPDFAQAHWNLAIAALSGGDLKRGFAAYEWRKRHPLYRADFPAIAGREWDGSDPAGRTILVRAEQGFGDAIQFARYLPLIQQAGGHPILVCAPSLVPLIGSMPGVRAIAPVDPPPAFDFWVDQMTLPRLSGTTIGSVPAPGAYLTASHARVTAWRDRLPDGPKIGIAFAGNPKHPEDRRRSIGAERLHALTTIPCLHWVNLQAGTSAAGLGLPDLSPWLTDYAETAALIANLDLVITVDTSVAHLAGALGKPVWVLLAHAPDWRWLRDRLDSPWYGSARLFRQPAPDDWDSVLAAVRLALDGAGL